MKWRVERLKDLEEASESDVTPMSGRMLGGLVQLGKSLRNVYFGRPMQECVRALSTSAPADKYIKPNFNFGHSMFGPDWGQSDKMGPDKLPISVDWSLVPGAVGPVLDQGETGLCYNFAAVHSVRSLSFLKTKKVVELSVQQVLDCNTLTGLGALGGLSERVLEYIKGGGIVPAAKYEYTGVRGVCKTVKACGVKIGDWKKIQPNDEAALKYAVAFQPVVVSIRTKQPILVGKKWIKFQNYEEGIMYGRASSSLDHSVLLIGYDETVDGEKYWIALNSHGCGWGQNGIFWIARGTGQLRGALGVLSEPMVPLMASRSTVISRCDSCATCFKAK